MVKKTSSSRRTTSRRPAAKGSTAKEPGVGRKLLSDARASLKDLLNGDTPMFIVGLVLAIASLFLFLAFSSYLGTAHTDQSFIEARQLGFDHNAEVHNDAGRLGAIAANFFINQGFGLTAFAIPLMMLVGAVRLMRILNVNLWRFFLNITFLMIFGSICLAQFTPTAWRDGLAYQPGGMHGLAICQYATKSIGETGLILLIILIALLYLIYLSRRTIIVIRSIVDHMVKWSHLRRQSAPADAETEDETETEATAPAEAAEVSFEPVVPIDLTEPEEEKAPEKPTKPKATRKATETTDEEEDLEFVIVNGQEEDKNDSETVVKDYDPKLDLEFYKYPTLDLLRKYPDDELSIDIDEQNANKQRIQEVLRSFGVEIASIKATVGPTVTLYEVVPAVGVKISKIKNLEEDIALSLAAIGIRIIAPIPGKGTIGIEVPNQKAKIVSIENILNSRVFAESKFELPIAMGRTIQNEIYMFDLAKAPHLLIAGATGQGKSVGLNAIITSLIYKKHPSELKMVLVDPKKVEFSVYAPLAKHFLAKTPDTDDEDVIITDVTKVVRTLKSLCQEMDDRYSLLKKARCRNIKEYNQKFRSRQLNPEKGHRFLPYFVIIIDEFGDLIMTAGREVELPIARIAQLARAVGMHMVIATQRPTTNIITGTIKANFPARIAFKVAAAIDSRTILDQTGANQLIGKGDMLILNGGMAPTRVQCAFIDTPEVEDVNNFIADQQGYTEAYILPEVIDLESDGFDNDAPRTIDKLDSMFDESARLIVVHQQGSTSLLQRKFNIGYNRAGRIMDQMESAGIVGPNNGAKPRTVLVSDEIQLQEILDDLHATHH